MPDAIAPERGYWPAFLVGCHRSGTTLTRYIIDAHSRIACPPESKFISGLFALQGSPHWQPSMKSLRLSKREVTEELGSFARRVLDSYAAKCNKKRWVDKTPNYYKILPFIDEMFRGQVLFVFIVRHPFDTMISLKEYFQAAGPNTEDPDIAEIIRRYGVGLTGWAQYWNDVYTAIHAFHAECGDARSMIFRYEDLVQNPNDTAERIFSFMGERLEEQLLENAFSAGHDQGLQDYKIFQTRAIHTRSVNRWKGWSGELSQVLWGIVSESASRYSYSSDSGKPF